MDRDLCGVRFSRVRRRQSIGRRDRRLQHTEARSKSLIGGLRGRNCSCRPVSCSSERRFASLTRTDAEHQFAVITQRRQDVGIQRRITPARLRPTSAPECLMNGENRRAFNRPGPARSSGGMAPSRLSRSLRRPSPPTRSPRQRRSGRPPAPNPRGSRGRRHFTIPRIG